MILEKIKLKINIILKNIENIKLNLSSKLIEEKANIINQLKEEIRILHIQLDEGAKNREKDLNLKNQLQVLNY